MIDVYKTNQYCRKLAFYSFAIGSFLFLFYFIDIRFIAKHSKSFKHFNFWFWTLYFYTVLAFGINSLALIALVIITFFKKLEWKKTLFTAFIMLLNIPIALFYAVSCIWILEK